MGCGRKSPECLGPIENVGCRRDVGGIELARAFQACDPAALKKILARALAREWRIPVLVDVLVRTRDTPTQTALTPETRLANVRAAFAVANVQCPMINDHWTLVIVDDVFTTGATLAEAARALEQAGATRIKGLTFARAAIPDFT